MATAAGYDVITTCLPSNFDYVKSFGAVKAFDYKSPTVTQDVVAELDKGECAGIYMAAGSNAVAYRVSAVSKQKVSKIILECNSIKKTNMGSSSWPHLILLRRVTFLKASRPSSLLAPAPVLLSLPKPCQLRSGVSCQRHWQKESTRSPLRHRSLTTKVLMGFRRLWIS